VYRVLSLADVAPDLLMAEVYVLWPDDGVWYAAIVEKVRVGGGGGGRRWCSCCSV
jgi:hypothetical protein